MFWILRRTGAANFFTSINSNYSSKSNTNTNNNYGTLIFNLNTYIFSHFIFFLNWNSVWLVVNDRIATGDKYIFNFHLKLEIRTTQAVSRKLNYKLTKKNGKELIKGKIRIRNKMRKSITEFHISQAILRNHRIWPKAQVKPRKNNLQSDADSTYCL